MTSEDKDCKFQVMMLPPEILNKIFYFAFIGDMVWIGGYAGEWWLGPDLDTLESCRQVCRDWSQMIKRSVWQSPNKEWGVITMAMIEKTWDDGSRFPSNKMISHAKDLDTAGILPAGHLQEEVR